jgi:hypothetical protein
MELINDVVQFNGMILYDVPYKLKTIDLCIKAVKNTGSALCYVPLNLLTIEMCFIAVNNDVDAYNLVPYIYKTRELKDFYVKKYLHTITNIDANDVTHSMILTILKDPFMDTYIQNIDYSNQNIRYHFINHFIEYVSVNENILNYLPFSLIYEDWKNMKHAININKNIFIDNHDKFNCKYVIELVKSGFDFCYIPSEYVTTELLNELVEARMSIIDELPVNFIYDGLYKICMEIHDMKIDDVPDEYRTEMILRTANRTDKHSMNHSSSNNDNDINSIELIDMSNNNNDNIILIDRVL